MSRAKFLTLGIVVALLAMLSWAVWYLFSPLDGYEERMARQQTTFLAQRCHAFHQTHGRYPTELRELVAPDDGPPVVEGGEAVIAPTRAPHGVGYSLRLDGKDGPFVWHDVELPRRSLRIGVRLLPDGTTVPFDAR